MKRFWMIFLIMACGTVAWGAVDWNAIKLTGLVNDTAGILSTKEHENLENLLQELKTSYGVELAFATVPTLEGYNIAKAAHFLYQSSELGRASSNQAALLLLNTHDNQMHLYVGMGLRGILSNKWVSVMSEKIEPLVAQRQFSKACITALSAMTVQVYNRSEELPRNSTRLVNKFHHFETVAGSTKAAPIAALAALLFGGILVVSTVMRAGRQTSVYEWGRDFERNRTGPFGNKKPRWL